VNDFSMADLWELSSSGEDVFVAAPPGTGFLFGGQTMALVLRAAGRTVSDHLLPKSLHCSFIRSGEWADPVELRVRRVNDSRSFAHRSVSAHQGGRLLVEAAISFHAPDEGVDEHLPAPEGPGPHELATDETVLGGVPGIIDVRPLEGPRPSDTVRNVHPYWARPHGPVDALPLLADCVTTFISDYLVVSTVFPEPTDRAQMVMTLTHTIWFHRQAHPEAWLRYDAEVVSLVGGRFLADGSIHDEHGVRVASFAQEALIRPRRT
jgi:acyl-CoA thioesterase-2